MSFPVGAPKITTGGTFTYPHPVTRSERWAKVVNNVFENSDGVLVVTGDPVRTFRLECEYTFAGVGDSLAKKLQDYFESGAEFIWQLHGSASQQATVVIVDFTDDTEITGERDIYIRIEEAETREDPFLL